MTGHSTKESSNKDVQKVLEEELNKLKSKTGVDLGLRVVWVPGCSREKSGEIKGNVIYVYEEDPEEAIRTLRHEFLDFLVSTAIQTYLLIDKIEVPGEERMKLVRRAYRIKEAIIEGLSKLIFG